MDDSSTEGSSKRAASEDPRTPSTTLDELATEAAQLDRMEITSTSSTSASARSRPSPEQQRQLIVLKFSLEPGTKVHIVKRTWWKTFREAISADEKQRQVSVDEVPPIDNTGLVDEGGRLLEPPKSNQTAVFVEPEHYELLKEWYGEIGASVERRVISTGQEASGRVEPFPPTFHLCRILDAAPSPNEEASLATELVLSAADTYGQFKSLCRAHLRLPADVETRYWRYKPSFGLTSRGIISLAQARQQAKPYVLAGDRETLGREYEGDHLDGDSLAIAGYEELDVYIAVEQQNDDGTWPTDVAPPIEPATAKPNFGGGFFETKSQKESMQVKYKKTTAPATNGPVASTSRIATRSQASPSSRIKGLVGLGNLGNTCFMNSALQCLSNTPELRDYFMADVWKDELNEDNPLGMEGQVARAYASLISHLWSGNSSSYSPREFKATIGRFRPMFLGWSQQDSQELTAFLLDGLHEDLNRIQKKPYVEIPDWEGEATPERMWKHAEHMWDLYRRRNDSVMIDLFFGQFRSTLTCLECGKISYKFDEFSSITLNLPKKPYPGSFKVIPLDPTKPKVDLQVELSADASISDAKVQCAKVLGLNAKRLIAVDVFHGKLYRYWADYEPISKIQRNDDIHFYEVAIDYRQTTPPPRKKRHVSMAERDNEAGVALVSVVNQRSENNRVPFTGKTEKITGLPSVLGVPHDQLTSYEAVYDAVARLVCRNSSRGSEMFEDEAEDLSGSTPDAKSTLAATPKWTPNRKLFRLLVSTETSSSPSSDLEKFVELEERIRSRRKDEGIAVPSAPIAIPGAFPNREDAAEATPRAAGADAMLVDGESAPVAEAEEAEEEQVAAPRPVVSTGDTIVVDWSAAALKQFFDGEANEWQTFEKMADPAIAQAEASRKSRTLSLDSCLRDFCKPERLGEDNPWKCPVCDKLQENTSKQLDLWKVPDILVIHLKRFSKGASSWGKMSDLVDFPLENWDLTNWVEGKRTAEQLKTSNEGRALLGDQFEDKPLLYDLFAVDNHYGGMGGGHYTAYAKNTNDGRWHHFDDSSVSDVPDPESIKTSAAYLLFYRRQTERSLGGPTVEKIQSAIQSRSVSAAGSDDGMLDADMTNETIDADQSAITIPWSTSEPSDSLPSYSRWNDRRGSDASNEADGGSDDGRRIEIDNDMGWNPVSASGSPPSSSNGDLPDAHAGLAGFPGPVPKLGGGFHNVRGRPDENYEEENIVFVNDHQDAEANSVVEIAEPAGPNGGEEDYVQVDRPAQ